MKKIVILIDQFYEHGGIEKLVALKANYWSKIFHYDITIIATENREKPYIYHLESSVKFIDLAINYNREISYFSIENMQLLLKNIVKLQSYIIKEKPDFIIVASHIPITYILPFLKLGKTKIIKEFHFTQYYRKDIKSIKKTLFNFIESKYDKLIVLSHEEKSYYNTGNVVVIPNPIENISVLEQKIEKENIVSAVVRFAPVKRLELMINIWDKFVKNGNSNWKLYIYGDYNNEYGKTIQELVKKVNLTKNIVFKGEVKGIINEIKKSKALLLTSEQECFPMVILEAHSVGVPVISFDCPTGPRNIINNKNGLLIENNNITEFVKNLEKFVSDRVLQETMSKNSYLNAKKYYIKNIMKKWKEEVFD